MKLALGLIIGWILAANLVGVPFWIWLKRRDESRDRSSEYLRRIA